MRASIASLLCATALLCFGLSDRASAASPTDETKGSAEALGVSRDWSLQGVVMLSRHGLRAPVDPRRQLNALTVSEWPNYGVPTGYLLPEGYARAVTLGRFYGLHYRSAGLLPAGCPTPGEATLLFDQEGRGKPGGAVQRDRETARALAEGMFPGCAATVSGEANAFSTPKECADPPRSDAASQRFVGGSWAAVADGPLRRPLAHMSAALGPLKASSCEGMPIRAGTTLSDYSAKKNDPGPIACSDELSENFLMQYEAGFAAGDVAFGRLGGGADLVANLKTVNKIHALDFAADFIPLYNARHASSSLAAVIRRAVNDIAQNNGRTPKFLALVGHDNELLNIAGMLGMSWTLPSYNKYQVPPTAGMAFEIWQTGDGPVVRPLYIAQTMTQMRANERLTPSNPPGIVRIPVDGCAGKAGSCALARFTAKLDTAILKRCVRPAKIGG